MRYSILGSGSNANAYLFEHDGEAFLFDNGFSLKELTRRAESSGFDLSQLKFIFLTHIHDDHLRGVAPLSRRYHLPVVAHGELDLGRYIKGDIEQKLDIRTGREYKTGALRFEAFPTSHDAPHSMGYHFTLAGTTFTILTDTGLTSEVMTRYAESSDVLFLEANYDETLLESCSYPRFLKKRIASDKGHLSNSAAVQFLNNLSPESMLSSVYFCHLSGNSNNPELLAHHVKESLEWKGRYRILKKGERFVPAAAENWEERNL
ncbi:MBL fold metallo-hydrolase [Sediminispirochaeta bajacaliforniensis]|uniref:MBL fold metallo-hydrolase n=1 Tax=Sediminispirochaeta bajacaliforniensis TaxID=148 RepID=UPI0003716F5B|nr:MBL fold metallo-hydrolase [Sediminispirochaeta bajacaliforniensis]